MGCGGGGGVSEVGAATRSSLITRVTPGVFLASASMIWRSSLAGHDAAQEHLPGHVDRQLEIPLDRQRCGGNRRSGPDASPR